ncbi:DUF3530 family protein [Thalassotalea profundi]|uniref:DUF3530 family protein n=1 Tax=Thalassotalea profundi TaxID=2036687 RepID=A0ABQ3ITI4_9GAMM|nr:DUF3530 family protein [Thalassotalea profundi]GHE92166.1 hypothetical protein GCM10011501_22120 [Thalassotalea profundi]
MLQLSSFKYLLSFLALFFLCFSLSAKQENETSPIPQEQTSTEEVPKGQQDEITQATESTAPQEQVIPAINNPKNIQAPINFLQQQQEDIKHYLEPDIVKPMLVGMKEEITLLEVNKTGLAKGVMILLPDWQQNATGSSALNFLRQQLPKRGWTTITIQPPAKPADYPSTALNREKRIENNQKTLIEYGEDLGLLLEQINEKAKEYPGVIVVISEGSNAALLTNIYQKQIAPSPAALILLSSFLPTIEDNKTVAASITQLPIPILDLTLFRDNNHVKTAAQLRSDAVKQEMKAFYRQKQLHNVMPSYYPNKLLLKEINGWLASIGW